MQSLRFLLKSKFWHLEPIKDVEFSHLVFLHTRTASTEQFIFQCIFHFSLTFVAHSSLTAKIEVDSFSINSLTLSRFGNFLLTAESNFLSNLDSWYPYGASSVPA
jgi:hypothetical protein